MKNVQSSLGAIFRALVEEIPYDQLNEKEKLDVPESTHAQREIEVIRAEMQEWMDRHHADLSTN